VNEFCFHFCRGAKLDKLKGLGLVWSMVALCVAVGVLAESAILPLGDGKISEVPRQGYVYACPLPPSGPGASRVGDWIQGNRWVPSQKIVVTGAVDWPSSSLELTLEDDKRIVRANNLPKHPTGVFPIEPTDPAYQYDRNPNAIQEQTILLTLPSVPEVASTPSCLPFGMIGFALSGTALYHALDLQRRDAPAYEIQDACNGHPEMRGQYHYHNYSPCLKDESGKAGKHSDLVGYALDGFGIYGLHGENGQFLTDADLDECHGHTHTLEWNGKTVKIYHYHFTSEYPYSLGCFKGVVSH
jgi:YHYH protein